MPSKSDLQRRLAAILVADVVGYSRLMAGDETGTLAALRERRKLVLEPVVKAHGGRIVKFMGDGVLVEFASAVNAVNAALDLQTKFAKANEGIAEDRAIVLRIGINLGDVIGEGEDIFGDGVNVAARLEALADPGGICVSGQVHDAIRGKVTAGFLDLGERQLKNIAMPVRAYAMSETGKASARPPSSGQSKPSIAVLPLTNMSGDPEQEFFSDGITEDIITELSRFKELFVIARNSTFVYKGKAVKIQDVARELGVNYVVEGSVRKAGARIRVTAQLIDAESGQHVWAERYDRQLEDVFAIQDEVTTAIVSVLPGRIEAARRDRATNRPTENMVAYELVLAGKVLHHRSTAEDNAEALRLLDKAIELDPKYAHAHAWRACVIGQRWTYRWGDRAELWREMNAELNTAQLLDDGDADVHRILAAIGISTKDFAKAEHHQRRALALNPNYDLVVVQQGELLTWTGRAQEGIEWIRRAMELNPFHPARYWSHLGRAYLSAGHHAQAVEALRRLTNPTPEQMPMLAAAEAGAGNLDAAKREAARVMAASASFSVAGYMATLHFQNDGDARLVRDLLLKAGLPE